MTFLYIYFMRRSKGFTVKNAARDAWRSVNPDTFICYAVGLFCSHALAGIAGWILRGIYAS